MPKPPSATVRTRTERVARILPILKRTYPNAKCSLDHASPLELLVATILSAQCTDDRVNIVTRTLFRKYRTPADYARVPQQELELDVQSTGFYRNKAKSLKGMAQALLDHHAGQVPQDMAALVELPGVGRKTANVVLGNAFGQNVGIVVDTHVGRLSKRLGLTKEDDPVKVELDLIPLIPQPDWALWSHLLIYHGRALCTARNPKCEQCPLLQDCPEGQKIVTQRGKGG